ncbi:MAG: hypothetical protein F6K65_38815, partial [Moorea sp. SIO3C2]|nr:hypothetical protein [Moorena sp. SIO3C2]
QHLQALVVQHTGMPAKELEIPTNPPWMDRGQVPEQVCQQVTAHHLVLTLQDWQRLTIAQRFALIKLSRPSHENRNFVPAMKEFGLAS